MKVYYIGIDDNPIDGYESEDDFKRERHYSKTLNPFYKTREAAMRKLYELCDIKNKEVDDGIEPLHVGSFHYTRWHVNERYGYVCRTFWFRDDPEETSIYAWIEECELEE